MIKSKSALGPVVATALLVVVAVFALVGFQNWFQSYSSNMFVDIESESISSSIEIETIIGNQLYIKSSENNFTLNKIQIDGFDCDLNVTLSSGMNNVSIGNCLSSVDSQSPNIVLFVEDIIVKEKHYLDKNYFVDCSILNGGEWIKVPGSSYFGIDTFCVMKYEADTQSGIANSSMLTRPGTWIEYNESFDNCSALGEGYHMITNREWMTIARQIETNPLNWNSSQVGVGFVYKGNSDGNENTLFPSFNDSDGYYGTNNDAVNGPNQKRTLILSNGEVIWDLSGNAGEWVNMNENGSKKVDEICGHFTKSFYGDDGEVECAYISPYSKDNSADKRFEIGPSGNYNFLNGVGRIKSYNGYNYVLRGGANFDSSLSGIYGIRMYGVGDAYSGFRCVYSK